MCIQLYNNVIETHQYDANLFPISSLCMLFKNRSYSSAICIYKEDCNDLFASFTFQGLQAVTPQGDVAEKKKNMKRITILIKKNSIFL